MGPFLEAVQLIWNNFQYTNSVNLIPYYSPFRTICSNYDIIGKNERINLNCIANSQINQICLLSANQKESFS